MYCDYLGMRDLFKNLDDMDIWNNLRRCKFIYRGKSKRKKKKIKRG